MKMMFGYDKYTTSHDPVNGNAQFQHSYEDITINDVFIDSFANNIARTIEKRKRERRKEIVENVIGCAEIAVCGVGAGVGIYGLVKGIGKIVQICAHRIQTR